MRRASRCSEMFDDPCGYSKEQLSTDAAFRTLVSEQSAAWSELVGRHRQEEWGSARARLNEQRDLLKKLMEQAQLAQLKQLEGKHERSVLPHVLPNFIVMAYTTLKLLQKK